VKKILSFVLIMLMAVGAPLQASAASAPIYAKAAIVMDAETGEVLYNKNAGKALYPASLTKIMTCYLALKYGDPNDMVTVDKNAVRLMREASKLGLVAGEQMTMSDMIYAMMLPSANDAAKAIAIHISGSESAFVSLMNREARALGVRNTSFRNAHGLPDKQHVASAYDLALITKAALQYPAFTQYAGASRHTLQATNKSKARTVKHLNAALDKNSKYAYSGAIAGKTGWTRAAGSCLMTVAQKNGRTLICVVLNSQGANGAKYIDTHRLLGYGFTTEAAPKTESLNFDELRSRKSA